MRFYSRGIVLSRESFGESDKYVQIFTQDWGLITVVAKAASKSRRRYIGGLDLFCHDEIWVKGDPRIRPYLQELTVLNSFQKLREDIDRVFFAGAAVQWVRRISDTAVPMPNIYSLLGQTLALLELETNADRMRLLTLIFRLKLLNEVGLKPRIEACVKCEWEEPESVVFDYAAGGAVCHACMGSHVSPGAFLSQDERLFLKLGDQIRLGAWSEVQLSSNKRERLIDLVGKFASFHTHMKLP